MTASIQPMPGEAPVPPDAAREGAPYAPGGRTLRLGGRMALAMLRVAASVSGVGAVSGGTGLP